MLRGKPLYSATSFFFSVFARFVTGARACDTHLYQRGAYPLGLIAPITVLWRPSPPVQKIQDSASSTGKERPNVPAESQRTLWIWAHPSVFEDVYRELRTAASFALETFKKTKPSMRCEVEIADLREQLNAFEIMGPKSSQVIKGALRPVPEDTCEEFKKVCRQ